MYRTSEKAFASYSDKTKYKKYCEAIDESAEWKRRADIAEEKSKKLEAENKKLTLKVKLSGATPTQLIVGYRECCEDTLQDDWDCGLVYYDRGKSRCPLTCESFTPIEMSVMVFDYSFYFDGVYSELYIVDSNYDEDIINDIVFVKEAKTGRIIYPNPEEENDGDTSD